METQVLFFICLCETMQFAINPVENVDDDDELFLWYG